MTEEINLYERNVLIKKILSVVSLFIATSSVATAQTGYIEYPNTSNYPAAWGAINGWTFTNGYLNGAPVQIADLPSDPENATSRDIDLDADVPANLDWIYRWRMTPAENATHTPFRRINFESVKTATDADAEAINYVGEREGPSFYIDASDLNAFLVLFNAGDLAADLTGDGNVDAADVTQFTTTYNRTDLYTYEDRVGFVYSGMWMGMSSSSLEDIERFRDVDSFVKVNNTWRCWTSWNTTVTSITSTHDSTTKLLSPPSGGPWDLLWVDEDALEDSGRTGGPIYIPNSVEPICQVDDIEVPSGVEVIWVKPEERKRATSWDTYRYVPAGSSLDLVGWGNSVTAITDYTEGPSDPFIPVIPDMHGPSFVNWYDYNLAIPGEWSTNEIWEKMSQSTLTSSGDQPWTVIPYTIDESSPPTTLEPVHDIGVPNPYVSYNTPRVVDLLPNPLYALTIESETGQIADEIPTDRDLLDLWLQLARTHTYEYGSDLYDPIHNELVDISSSSSPFYPDASEKTTQLTDGAYFDYFEDMMDMTEPPPLSVADYDNVAWIDYRQLPVDLQPDRGQWVAESLTTWMLTASDSHYRNYGDYERDEGFAMYGRDHAWPQPVVEHESTTSSTNVHDHGRWLDQTEYEWVNNHKDSDYYYLYYFQTLDTLLDNGERDAWWKTSAASLIPVDFEVPLAFFGGVNRVNGNLTHDWSRKVWTGLSSNDSIIFEYTGNSTTKSWGVKHPATYTLTETEGTDQSTDPGTFELEARLEGREFSNNSGAYIEVLYSMYLNDGVWYWALTLYARETTTDDWEIIYDTGGMYADGESSGTLDFDAGGGMSLTNPADPWPGISNLPEIDLGKPPSDTTDSDKKKAPKETPVPKDGTVRPLTPEEIRERWERDMEEIRKRDREGPWDYFPAPVGPDGERRWYYIPVKDAPIYRVPEGPDRCLTCDQRRRRLLIECLECVANGFICGSACLDLASTPDADLQDDSFDCSADCPPQ